MDTIRAAGKFDDTAAKLRRMYPFRMSVCKDESEAEERRLRAHDDRIRKAKAKKKAKY